MLAAWRGDEAEALELMETGRREAIARGEGRVMTVARDILVNEIPEVLRGGLYAVPALLGATVVVVASEAGSQSAVFPLAGMLACLAVRLFALRQGVNRPRDD